MAHQTGILELLQVDGVSIVGTCGDVLELHRRRTLERHARTTGVVLHGAIGQRLDGLELPHVDGVVVVHAIRDVRQLDRGHGRRAIGFQAAQGDAVFLVAVVSHGVGQLAVVTHQTRVLELSYVHGVGVIRPSRHVGQLAVNGVAVRILAGKVDFGAVSIFAHRDRAASFVLLNQADRAFADLRTQVVDGLGIADDVVVQTAQRIAHVVKRVFARDRIGA